MDDSNKNTNEEIDTNEEIEIWDRDENESDLELGLVNQSSAPEIWDRDESDSEERPPLENKGEFERDHSRKLWALAALIAGFFISSSIDVWQDAYKEIDPWITNIFVTSIVPVLAFILGTNVNNNK